MLSDMKHIVQRKVLLVVLRHLLRAQQHLTVQPVSVDHAATIIQVQL